MSGLVGGQFIYLITDILIDTENQIANLATSSIERKVDSISFNFLA